MATTLRIQEKRLYNWLASDTGRLHLPANKVKEVRVKVGAVLKTVNSSALGPLPQMNRLKLKD